jgi:8-oxo-dGTP diphosphatase
MRDVGTTGRTRVAAYALCHDEAGRILLCHIAPSVGVGDIWTLPGGGLDFGEAPAHAAVRELEEETGLRGEVVRLLDVGSRFFTPAHDGERLHAIRIVYQVRIVGGTLRDEPDGSTDAAGWFSREEALGLRLGELSRAMLDWPIAGDGSGTRG